MEKLLKGILHFKENDFRKYKEHFTTISRGQSPHTLFIGCSDSRIDPSLITKTIPGELFIVRNIANIVPRYRDTEEYVSTTSAIEYALEVLKVENIVICGHSNCGGCNALWNDNSAVKTPHTARWLELAKPVREIIESTFDLKTLDVLEKEWITEQLNVVEQMKHLLTYPGVKERVEKGTLNILGWYYVIGTGEIFNYNSKTECFEPVQ